LAAAIAALIFGVWFDRAGLRVLVFSTLMSASFAPVALGGRLGSAVSGTILWGIGMGAQESIMSAAIADMTSPEARHRVRHLQSRVRHLVVHRHGTHRLAITSCHQSRRTEAFFSRGSPLSVPESYAFATLKEAAAPADCSKVGPAGDSEPPGRFLDAKFVRNRHTRVLRTASTGVTRRRQ
jgi:hypothetical protein